MAARRYRIYLRVLKNFSRVSAANERSIFQHEKVNFASPSDHVIFFLSYKIFTIDNDVCGDFPKISEDFSKFKRGPDERFRTFFDDFWKFSEDYQRRLKKIPRCFDHTQTNLSVVKGTIKSVIKNDIFACQDIISFLTRTMT